MILNLQIHLSLSTWLFTKHHKSEYCNDDIKSDSWLSRVGDSAVHSPWLCSALLSRGHSSALVTSGRLHHQSRPECSWCPTWCPPHPPLPTPTTQLRLLQKYLGSLTTAATPHTQCLLMLEIYKVCDISKCFIKQVFSMVEVWTATAEQYRCLLGDDGRY